MTDASPSLASPASAPCTLAAGRRLAQAVCLLVLAAGLPGCAAVSALSSASRPLDAYSVAPLAAAAPGATRGSRHIVVPVPSASGAIATERILVTPSRLQAAYLPGAAWVDSAPVMMQTVLVQSLQASGAFRLVGRAPEGFLNDYTLLSELRAFQAEPGPEGGPPYLVRVALTLTLARESDGVLLASRDFSASAASDAVDPLAIVTAFNAATSQVLLEAVEWTIAAARGGAV